MASRVGEKGYTGNPGGRPKMSEEHRKAFTEISAAGISALRAILANPESKDSDKIKAAEVAFDRSWGKAIQQAELTGEDGGAIEIIKRVILNGTDAKNT